MTTSDTFDDLTTPGPREGGIGDNSGDEHEIAFAEISAKLDAFLAGADVWEQRAKLPDDEIAKLDADDIGARLNDFITGAGKLAKLADAARVAEKKPHDDAAKAVQAKWKPILDKLDAVGVIGKKLLKRLADHKKKLADEAKARAAEAERAAREAREKAEADEAAARTVKERLEAKQRADEAAERENNAREAMEQNSAPVRFASATGAANTRSVKTRLVPVIVSLPGVFHYYRGEAELSELLLKFAARDLRAAPTVNGEKQTPTIVGIEWKEEETL